MLELAWPWAFLLLPLPLVVYWFMRRAPRQDAALHVPFYRQLRQLHTDSSHQYRRPAALLVCALIWLLLVTAASKPQWVGEPVQLPTSGRDMMLALDLSGSMEARDMFFNNTQLSRFEAMKEVVGDFVEQREGDRIGMILFAANAYMLTPMTHDLEAVQRMLDDLQVGVIDESATAIGDAIGLSVKHLQTRPQNNRLLVLLTDGINNAGELTPSQAAQLAVTEDIRMHVVGVASDQNQQQSFFSRRSGGVSSEIDDATMTEIAEMTGGRYFRARTLEDLIGIYDEIDQMEPIEQDEQTFRPVSQLFHWPLGGAVLLSFLLTLLTIPPAGWLPTRGRPENSVSAGPLAGGSRG